MRNLLISMFTVLVMTGGAALAQDVVVVDDNEYWAGFSAGYPGAAVHFGIDGLADDLGVRFNLGYAYAGAFAFGVDALYDLNVDTDGAPLDVYVGGGLGASIDTDDDLDSDGGFTVKALVGGEFYFADAGIPQLGVFAEVGPAIRFGGGFGIDGRLGVNYHF